MKVLWHSNAPHATTGYGSQTALFTPLIRDAGHQVAISAFWGAAGKTTWDGMRVYPADRNYGNEWLVGYATDYGDGDPRSVQIITLMDVWVLTTPLLKELNVASWVPIDHVPVPPNVLAYFHRTDAVPIAMSLFGQQQLQAAGLDALYVPHGVDTEALCPVDRAAFRDKLNIDQDAFVVGMVAANKGNNPPRKAFPQAFTAFAMLHKQHPDTVLYLHTEMKGGDYDLDLYRWLEVCGVPEDAVRITPQFELAVGIDYAAMALMYSNLDVLLQPSYGEGFGIPIVEAQACGVPVIVNDFSAMPELCGAGWKVEGQPDPHISQGAWWQAPNIGSIYECLEAAYDEAGGMRERAREFAVGYDTRVVMEQYWTPVLERLEAELDAKPKELRPVA